MLYLVSHSNLLHLLLTYHPAEYATFGRAWMFCKKKVIMSIFKTYPVENEIKKIGNFSIIVLIQNYLWQVAYLTWDSVGELLCVCVIVYFPLFKRLCTIDLHCPEFLNNSGLTFPLPQIFFCLCHVFSILCSSAIMNRSWIGIIQPTEWIHYKMIYPVTPNLSRAKVTFTQLTKF